MIDEEWEVNGGTDVWFGDHLCIWAGTEERAALIAAAPKLYKALDALLRAIALKDGDLVEALNSAAAAILAANVGPVFEENIGMSEGQEG